MVALLTHTKRQNKRKNTGLISAQNSGKLPFRALQQRSRNKMGLVVARERRPVTRVRHAGGSFWCKTHVNEKLVVILEHWSSRSPCSWSPHHRALFGGSFFVFSRSQTPDGSGAFPTSTGRLSQRGPVAEPSPPPQPRWFVWRGATFTRQQRTRQTMLAAWMCV